MVIVNWTYLLQIKLEAMDEIDFTNWMKNKAIRFNGKLYNVEGVIEKETKEVQ